MKTRPAVWSAFFAAASLAAGCAHEANVQIQTHGTHHHGHDAAPEDGEAYVHHGGNHRFDDAEKWAGRFEDPARDEWQHPDEVIAAMQLEPTMRLADIGAATGYFPVRIAPRVPKGRVWGVDIEPEMVRYLNARARRENHANLFAILGRPEDPMLPEPVDRVLIVNTYHHITERRQYFEQLARYLNPGAWVVIVDFKKGDLPFGPPDAMKLSPEEVTAEMEAAGYVVQARVDTLPHQYVVIFRRGGVAE